MHTCTQMLAKLSTTKGGGCETFNKDDLNKMSPADTKANQSIQTTSQMMHLTQHKKALIPTFSFLDDAASKRLGDGWPAARAH
jgi:hypothetical protein